MSGFDLSVTIAGIDVTDYITGGFVEDSLSFEISKAELIANSSIDDAVTLTGGQTIKIWRDYNSSITDADLIFDGKIELFESQNYQYKIYCFDQLGIAKARTVSRVFLDSEAEAGKLSEIFKELINDYTGLTADATSVQDSGTALVLSQFRCYDAYVYERCKKLATALNWRFYYNPRTQLVNFEPRRYTANTNALDGDNLATVPTWGEDKSELANAITVKGAQIQSRTSESFAGPATSVTLTYKPDEMKVTVGGTLKTGGQPGDGSDYYYDKETKKVTFAASSSTIVVDYSYSSPLPLYATNPTSIATYGEWEKVLTLLETSTVEDLQTRLVNALALYSTPFNTVTGEYKNITDYGYQVGQAVTITDPWTAQTGTYTIRKLVKNLRTYTDKYELGDKEFRFEGWLAFDMEYRIKKLEEESTKDTGVVTNLVQFKHEPELRRKSITRTIQRINDSFILGHPGANGKLGRGAILESWEDGTTGWSGTNCTLSSQEDT